eukprot:scaffold11_cov257-Pinguiococcus_pyrenoidosus.AAC.58
MWSAVTWFPTVPLTSSFLSRRRRTSPILPHRAAKGTGSQQSERSMGVAGDDAAPSSCAHRPDSLAASVFAASVFAASVSVPLIELPAYSELASSIRTTSSWPDHIAARRGPARLPLRPSILEPLRRKNETTSD